MKQCRELVVLLVVIASVAVGAFSQARWSTKGSNASGDQAQAPASSIAKAGDFKTLNVLGQTFTATTDKEGCTTISVRASSGLPLYSRHLKCHYGGSFLKDYGDGNPQVVVLLGSGSCAFVLAIKMNENSRPSEVLGRALWVGSVRPTRDGLRLAYRQDDSMVIENLRWNSCRYVSAQRTSWLRGLKPPNLDD